MDRSQEHPGHQVKKVIAKKADVADDGRREPAEREAAGDIADGEVLRVGYDGNDSTVRS